MRRLLFAFGLTIAINVAIGVGLWLAATFLCWLYPYGPVAYFCVCGVLSLLAGTAWFYWCPPASAVAGKKGG